MDAPDVSVAFMGAFVVVAFWLLTIALAVCSVAKRKQINRMHLIGGILPAILLSLPVVPFLSLYLWKLMN